MDLKPIIRELVYPSVSFVPNCTEENQDRANRYTTIITTLDDLFDNNCALEDYLDVCEAMGMNMDDYDEIISQNFLAIGI